MYGQHADSVMKRIPTEMWWMILDMVISSPRSLATTYVADDWATDGNVAFRFHELDDYREAESRRKQVGMVCKSWQSFAVSRRDRYLVLQQEGERMSADEITVSKARRINIKECKDAFIRSIAQDACWEILEASEALIRTVGDLLPPRLRRLILFTSNGQSEILDSNRFLSILTLFRRLTWLECHISTPNASIPVKNDNVHIPIVLPNVQVLIHHSSDMILFPFDCVELPSLQYLSVYSMVRQQTSSISLINIITRYRRTLRSVIFLAQCPADDFKEFPPWSDFPHLEELMLESTFKLHFPPLPPTHPLRKIIVRQWSIPAILSWINSINMRQIMLLDAIWNWDGKLCGRSSNVFMTAAEIGELKTRAKLRGILLQISGSGDEVYRKSITGQRPRDSKFPWTL
jgi:hypothetical protein